MNKTTELARQHRRVPPSMLSLLERLIEERSEYTYWLSQKSATEGSKSAYESHHYYIKVLKETKTILAERMEPTASPVLQSTPSQGKAIKAPSQTYTKTLGKRKASATTLQGSEQGKASKTESAASKSEKVKQRGANQSAAATSRHQANWRRVVANSCSKTALNLPAPAPAPAPALEPLSYAAASRVTATA